MPRYNISIRNFEWFFWNGLVAIKYRIPERWTKAVRLKVSKKRISVHFRNSPYKILDYHTCTACLRVTLRVEYDSAPIRDRPLAQADSLLSFHGKKYRIPRTATQSRTPPSNSPRPSKYRGFWPCSAARFSAVGNHVLLRDRFSHCPRATCCNYTFAFSQSSRERTTYLRSKGIFPPSTLA